MKKYIAILCILLGGPAFAEIYKWTDESGRVHYSDTASKDRPVEKLDIDVNSYKHVSVMQSHTRTAKVTMYSTSWCGYCKKARKYFVSNGIPFRELDVEKNRRAKREYEAMNGKGVPIILVGKKRMNGFSVAGFKNIYK